MMTVPELLTWLRDEHNRGVVTVIVLVLATLVGASWTLFRYAYPSGLPSDSHGNLPPLPPLGSFNLTVKNESDEILSVSGAEYYIQEPGVPGVNKNSYSGVVELEGQPGYSFEVPAKQTVTVSAALMKESYTLSLLEQRNGFIRIILSTSPKPVTSEVVFSRNVLQQGMEFEYAGRDSATVGRPTATPKP